MSIMRESSDAGTGVGSVIGSVFGSNADPHKDVDGVGASIDNFTSQAAAGDISVDAQGGAALLKFAEDVQQWYADHVSVARFAASPPELGTSVAAQAVSPFMARVGVDEHGYLVQMHNLTQRMEQFKAGVHKAMETYQRNEGELAGGFKP